MIWPPRDRWAVAWWVIAAVLALNLVVQAGAAILKLM